MRKRSLKYVLELLKVEVLRPKLHFMSLANVLFSLKKYPNLISSELYTSISTEIINNLNYMSKIAPFKVTGLIFKLWNNLSTTQ